MQSFISWLDSLICSTAWPMETPKAYGTFHILYTVIGFAVCALVAWKLRKVSDKGSRAVLLTVGLFLLASEIYKQLLYYFYFGGHSYDWSIFPFQFCSVPMYLCILAPLLKPGKLQKSMYSFMMIYNLLGGAIAFLEPSGLLHSYWTLTFHSLIWHMLLVFVGLFLCFSGRGGKDIRDYKRATGMFLLFCLIAFLLNTLLHDASGGSMNLFFVGPGNSPLIIVKSIAERFGWLVGTVLYVPAVCFGAYLIFSLIRLLKKEKK